LGYIASKLFGLTVTAVEVINYFSIILLDKFAFGLDGFAAKKTLIQKLGEYEGQLIFLSVGGTVCRIFDS